MTSEYAQYGVTEGVMHSALGEILSCGIICDEWPSWAFGLQIRGWNIRYILVYKKTWEQELGIWFPLAKIMCVNDALPVHGESLGVLAWFSDSDPPRKLKLWDYPTKLIVTRRRARHLPGNSWCMTAIPVSHSSCGGG